MSYTYKQLTPNNLSQYKTLMKLFGEVFGDTEDYQGKPPSEKYIKDFLNDPVHIILVALDDNNVVGGLAAYVLKKFEREKSVIYIYDLAVSTTHQKQGIGTSLIENIKNIAKHREISTIFLQADKSDSNAVNFYKTLSTKQEETYNFDFEI